MKLQKGEVGLEKHTNPPPPQKKNAPMETTETLTTIVLPWWWIERTFVLCTLFALSRVLSFVATKVSILWVCLHAENLKDSFYRERIIVPLYRRLGHLKFTYPGQYRRHGRLPWHPLLSRRVGGRGSLPRGCQCRRGLLPRHRLIFLLCTPVVFYTGWLPLRLWRCQCRRGRCRRGTDLMFNIFYTGSLVYTGNIGVEDEAPV